MNRTKRQGYRTTDARISLFFTALMIIIVLSACGTSNSPVGALDPSKVTVQVRTEPTTIKAGTDTKFIIDVSGLNIWKGSYVEMDIKREGQEKRENVKTEPVKMGSEKDKNGTFTVTKKFPDPGNYTAVVHASGAEVHKYSSYEFTVTP